MANIMGDNLHKLTDGESLAQYRDSEYLGSIDIEPGKEPIVTIEGIYHGKVTLAGRKQDKGVVNFVEKSVPGLKTVRPLVLNATTLGTLNKLFGGTEPRHLVGRRIQLYVDHNVRDPQNGGTTDGVRIRPHIPKGIEQKCADCMKVIKSAHGMSAERVAEHTKKTYGRILCAECGAKAKAEKEAAKTEGDVLSNENNETQN